MKIIAGNSNMPLAEAIAEKLAIKLVTTNISCFADGEISVEILENIRGEDVFVIQSTSRPVNQNLMEMLLTLDALKRSSAKRVTAVMPYFGYARQDRKSGPRTPISAKLVANLITQAGANRVLTLDLHAGQIQGFFDIPVDNLYAAPLFANDIKDRNFEKGSITVVSPDVGGVVRARELAKRLNTDLAIIDKRRPRAGVSEVMNVIGDVENRECILIDDMVDSGGTLINAAVALLDRGANTVNVYVTHGILSNNAVEKINNSRITSISITDSIKPTNDVLTSPKFRVISISELISEAVDRISGEKSVSSLFV